MKAAGVLAIVPVVSLLIAAVASEANAQSSQPPPASAEDLQILVAPVALYPDSLLAHILPASTVPIDVVEAARYLRDHGGKVEDSPDVPWLPSVRALLRFPDVLYKMDEDLSWTQDLGAAVIAQQNDVMNAIQHVRKIAQETGALQTNDKQVVQVEKEVIKIVPADPEVIYVPVYDPEVIYVQQPSTVVVVDDNDDEAAAALIGFGVGFLVGAAFADDYCDWYGFTIYHGGYYGWVGPWRPVATPYNPRGIYDPRGVYDPRGAYDPRGIHDPRGAYDPRGVADPRGIADTRGLADTRGVADPRGVADTRGLADTRGVADPRGAAVSRGYANPSATSGTGTFGSVGQNSSLSRQSTRGASSLSSSGFSGSAFSGGGRSGGGRGRR